MPTDQLIWQQIHWPRPLPEAVAFGLLRDWAAQPHRATSGPLVLEARSSVPRAVDSLPAQTTPEAPGITYLVGCPSARAEAVARGIEQLVRGSAVEVIPGSAGERPPVHTARRLRLSTTTRLLDPRDPVASTRSILHALMSVTAAARHDGDGDHAPEQLVIQLVLGARRLPRPLPAELPDAEQSIVSKMLSGVRTDPQPDARAALKQKLGDFGFRATIRLGVSAGSAGRRQQLLLGLAAAMDTAAAPGVSGQLQGEAAERLNDPHSSAGYSRLASWSSSLGWLVDGAQALTITEVARLSGWPISNSPDDSASYPGQPPAHPLPLRPSSAVLAIPSRQAGSQASGRVVAMANAPGTGGAIGYGIDDALRHSWVIGPSGVGKSTLLLNLIVQDLEANRPVVVIEPKDLVADVLARIPAHRVADVVVLDPLDSAPVGINPLSRAGSGDHRSPDLIADSLFGTFHALYGEAIGARSSDILRNCLDVLAVRSGTTSGRDGSRGAAGSTDTSLIMLPLLLTNPGFRRSLTQDVVRRDPFAAGPFWQWFDGLNPEAAAHIVAPLSNKIRPLLGRHLRAVLAQRDPRFNVRQVLRERKVLLVPLQKGVIGPESAQLLGALVIAELWQAIRERAGQPEHSRQPVMIYVDEVQDYLRLPTDLGDALATARSLGAGFHLAHQYEGQLPAAMRDAFRSNARSRICFQLGADDAKAMAAGQTILSPEDFTALPAHQVYARLMRDNSVQPWASGITLPPPPVTSDPEQIRAFSRARYGQPLGEIEAGFAALLDPATDTQPDDDANSGHASLPGRSRRRTRPTRQPRQDDQSPRRPS